MILKFTVANFRCYRDKQHIDFFAHPAERQNPEATTALPPFISKRKRAVLSSVGIFGPNASGKSNILYALRQLQVMVADSAKDPDNTLRVSYTPFLLNEDSRNNPIHFSLDFIVEEVFYRYTVEFNDRRVLTEELTAFPNERPQHWFTREYQGPDSKQAYAWKYSSLFDKSDDKLVDRTREEALFLSTAGQWNHPQLKPLRDWIVNAIIFSSDINLYGADFTLAQLEKNKDKDLILYPGLFINAEPGVA